MKRAPKRPSEGPLVVVQVIGGYALLLLTSNGDTTRLVGYNDEQPVEFAEFPCEDESPIPFSEPTPCLPRS